MALGDGKAKKEAQDLKQELAFMYDAITSLGDKLVNSFEQAVDEAGNMNNAFEIASKTFQRGLAADLKQSVKNTDELIDLYAKLKSDTLTQKDLAKAQEKIDSNRLRLQVKRKALGNDITKQQQEFFVLQSAELDKQQEKVNEYTKENDLLQKQKGFFKILSENAGSLADKLDKSGTLSKILQGNILKTLTPLRLFEIAVLGIFNAFKGLDKTTKDVAQQLGVSYHEAQGMNKEFSQIAQDSNSIFVTTQGVAKSQIELSKILGTNAMFTAEMLQTQTQLTHQLGLSAETSGEIAKLGLLTGKTSKEIASNVLGQSVAMNAANGTAITEKEILKEVAKLSSSIQLSMANNPIELAKAVQTAKQFGMELSAVDGIAGSLMDFESSITNELEAELLLGKNINLEKARQAALNNDLATVAEEIAKQAGSAAEFTAMNRIQQEALAKAVGLSRDDLAKSLQEREALAKLGTDATTSQEAYNKLLSQGLSQEQIAAQLGDEKLADQLQANNIQERFNQSIQKAQEIFVNIASAISPFILGLAKGVEYIAIMVDKFSTILGIVGGIYSLNLLNNAANAISAGYQAKKLVAKEYELGLGGQILTLMGLENAAIAYKVARMEGMNVLSAIGVALEQTKLGAIVAQGIGMVKNLGKILIENAARMVGMATALATNSFATFGVGVAVALAAAAAGIMAVKSLTKADDLMSEGTSGSGYGGRVLLAGKDAFALNNSDTVLAGTNLGQGGGGGTDMSKTNKLLEKILGKTPEMAPLGLYEVQ